MSIPFLHQQIIYRSDVPFRVMATVNAETVQLQNMVSGEYSSHKPVDLLTEYVACSLQIRATGTARTNANRKTMKKPARMSDMGAVDKTETRRRLDYLTRLDNLGSFNSPRQKMKADLLEISRIRGEARPPHETSVYRWRRAYLRAGNEIRAIFTQFGARGGKNVSRLDPRVESLVLCEIDEVMGRGRRWSAEDIEEAIKIKVDKLNEERVPGEQLAMPSRRTLQRRLAAVPAFDIAVARFGLQEANRRFALHGTARRAQRILEIVEIDHSPVDILIVDENGIVIERPTVTVVLDRYSRCVLGYHLSACGHGVQAVFEALRHALLPKTYLSNRYADLSLAWECYGWFERLVMDNGLEFHANAVTDALINVGIVAEYAKSRQPNDKPFVERFLLTFNYSFIHKLPGTTFAKVGDRIGFNAEDGAALTLERLDRLIHVWICKKYHLRPHKGLDGRTPISVWRESAQAYPPQLKVNVDDLLIEFSVSTTSALQHYGIDLNTFQYTNARLLTLRRLLPPKARVDVKWGEGDVGHVWVWDRFESEFFKVENVEDEFNGLSLTQARAVKARRAEVDPADEPTRAVAAATIKDIVDEAIHDKKLKVRRQGARLAGMSSKRARQDRRDPVARTEQDDIVSDEEASAPIAPFEIEMQQKDRS